MPRNKRNVKRTFSLSPENVEWLKSPMVNKSGFVDEVLTRLREVFSVPQLGFKVVKVLEDDFLKAIRDRPHDFQEDD